MCIRDRIEGSKASTSYKAKLTVAVTPADGYQKSTLEDIQKNEELVGLYAKISTSSKTLDRVAQYAGLDEKGRIALNSRVAVDFDKDGQYVDIYITEMCIRDRKEGAPVRLPLTDFASTDMRGEFK